MPELPEVENVRRGLNQIVVGERINKVDVYWPRIIESPADSEFKSRLIGQKIEKVERRGKFLLFYFTKDVMISHLRMEGKYQLAERAANQAPALTKHTHVVFHFESGKELRYLDVRKFGRMSLVTKGEEFQHKSLNKLGPEPVKEDFHFSEMQQFLKRRTKAIKGVLLDQQMVVGVGNIYADEILFTAGIHPARSANTLTEDEEHQLYKAILSILEKAVKNGGTTIRTYQNAFGDSGTFQNHLQMYGKEGTACVVCGGEIEKIKVAGRGTHYCPICQPLKG